MPCILLFEIKYSLEFVSTNPPFLSRPSNTKIKTAIIWCQLQQKSQKFENILLWTSIFRYANLNIVSLIARELFNRNLSIFHPTLFLKFHNSRCSWKTIVPEISVRFSSFFFFIKSLKNIRRTFQGSCTSTVCNFIKS